MALERVLESEVMDTWEDAVEYDSMDFTEVNEAFAQRALELGPSEGIILDVGTGTTRIPIIIVQRRPMLHIWGIDLSENMLKLGKKNIEAAGLDQNIKLGKADAKSLPYPESYCEMLISNTIVHHLPDPIPFLKEVKRVTKPNGAIFLKDLIRPANDTVLNELVDKYACNCTEYQNKLYRDSLHAAFTVEEIKRLIEESGLKDMTVTQSSDRHWSAERPWRPPSDKKFRLPASY